jgi:hypothetical protein
MCANGDNSRRSAGSPHLPCPSKNHDATAWTALDFDYHSNDDNDAD